MHKFHFYSTKEFSNITGISISKLERWDKEGMEESQSQRQQLKDEIYVYEDKKTRLLPYVSSHGTGANFCLKIWMRLLKAVKR